MSDIISQISTAGPKFVEKHQTTTTVSASDIQGMEINKTINPTGTSIPEATSNIWTSSAKEVLAVIDIYNTNGKQVLTSYESLKKLMDSSALDGFKKGGFTGKLDLFKKFMGEGKKLLDNKAILDKVTAALPSLKSVLGQIPMDGKAFSSLFKDIDFSMPNFSFLDGIKTSLPDFDLKDLTGLKKFTEALTGAASGIDFGNVHIDTKLLSNVIKTCSATGMVDSIPKLMALAKDKGVLIGVARDCLINCSNTGDLNLLKTVSDTLGKNGVIGINPDILTNIGKAISFTTPEPTQATTQMVFDPDYKKFLDIHGPYGASDGVLGQKKYDEIKAAYASVDDQWQFSKETFNETGVFDARLASGATDGFKDIFISGSRVKGTEDDQAFMLGTLFKPTTVEAQIASDFPLVVTEDARHDVKNEFSPNIFPFKPQQAA